MWKLNLLSSSLSGCVLTMTKVQEKSDGSTSLTFYIIQYNNHNGNNVYICSSNMNCPRWPAALLDEQYYHTLGVYCPRPWAISNGFHLVYHTH